MNKLPALANLEHGRNEAKRLLRDLRRTSPDATLADAQLEVARRYGFASWRQLESHVDAGLRLVNAVRAGDLVTMRAVLDQYAELVDVPTDLEEHQVRPSDALTMRLIHLAVSQDDIGAARLLVERGANLNVRNADGRLPIHDCFELGKDEFARFLLSAGAEADVCAAAAYGMYDRLVEILKGEPEQANDLRTGISPLGWSVYGQKPESAQILFEHGAVVDRPPYDLEAWGPAAHVANINVTRLLLANGANPNCRNKTGDTPIHAAIKSRLVVDPTAMPGAATQFPGVTKMTVGLSMHDGLTMEAWLDTPSALVAKGLTARLQKNPNEAPLFSQVGGAVVEQRDNSVRIYARVTSPQGASRQEPEGSPTSNPTPGLGLVKRSKVAEVQTGMDRASVEAVLGKPHSVMAIQGSDEAIETLIYNLDDKAIARVRTVNGKVVSVQFSTD